MIKTTIFGIERKLSVAWLWCTKNLSTWPPRRSALHALKKDLQNIRKNVKAIEWANVNYVENISKKLEKKWGKLTEQSIAGLTIREFNTYSQVREVCLDARKSLNTFYDNEMSKETLTSYLLNGQNDAYDAKALYVLLLNGSNSNYGVLHQIARHYNIKNLNSGAYLMYAPYWLMIESVQMNSASYTTVANIKSLRYQIGDSANMCMADFLMMRLDYYLTDSDDVVDTVKTLWDPWGEGPFNSISSLGESAKLLCR